MTIHSSSDAAELQVAYESEARTFGGFVAADFILRRPHHHAREVNLGLAQDGQALFEATAGPLAASALQAVLRVLADRVYPAYIEAGQEPPAIVLLRADDIDVDEVGGILAEAGIA